MQTIWVINKTAALRVTHPVENTTFTFYFSVRKLWCDRIKMGLKAGLKLGPRMCF